MARYLDVAFGMLLGVIGTGAIVAVAAAPKVDPVRLSPQYYKVRLDNARVRVLEFRSLSEIATETRPTRTYRGRNAGITSDFQSQGALSQKPVNPFPDGAAISRPSEFALFWAYQ